MKRLAIAMSTIVLTVSVFAQSSDSILWSMKIFPKMDKVSELEKKIPLFLKTHFPTLSFRVYETITGPNTGSFVIVSGPYSYAQLDVPLVSPKGEPALDADDAALKSLYQSYEVQHGRIATALNIPNPKREIKYILVTDRELQSGSWNEVSGYILKIREAREKGGSKNDMAYYRPSAGGNLNSFTTVRFFSKWEDLDYQENLEELYDKIHGRASFSNAGRRFSEIVKSAKQEVRVLRKDLSVAASAPANK